MTGLRKVATNALPTLSLMKRDLMPHVWQHRTTVKLLRRNLRAKAKHSGVIGRDMQSWQRCEGLDVPLLSQSPCSELRNLTHGCEPDWL